MSNTYLSPDNFIPLLETLRKDYEQKNDLELSTAPQPYAISRSLGAKDVKARHAEISFIEALIETLNPMIVRNNKFGTQEQLDNHLYALSVLKAASFFIISKVNKKYWIRSETNSDLVKLLYKAMEICASNKMDDETKSVILTRANHFISSREYLALIKESPLAEEGEQFIEFISKTQNKLKRTDYPVSEVTIPLFARSFEVVGASVGVVLGNVASKSSAALPIRSGLTAAIGSGLLMLRVSSPMGVMLVVPTIATQLTSVTGSFSVGYVLGFIMKQIGTAVGFGVGRSIDITTKEFYHACAYLIAYLQGELPKLQFNGFNLINGLRIEDGVPVVAINEDVNSKPASSDEGLLPAEEQALRCYFTHDEAGIHIHVGDKVETVPWEDPSEELNPDLVALRKRFKDMLLSVERGDKEEIKPMPAPVDTFFKMGNSALADPSSELLSAQPC